ncbi:MAG: hypothetical protein AAFR93_01005 [Pseudomonadota bacterium]
MITQDDLQGRWRRAWLKAPGREDHDTHVEWWQAGAQFADIRIPAARDVTGARCLADLSPHQLETCLAAEGFAGVTEVAGGVCTWHRHLNWWGPPDGVDAGKMSYDGAGDLIEEGVEGDYSELWRGTAHPPLASQRYRGHGLIAVLVSDPERFLVAIGPAALPDKAPQGLARFASEYSLGTWTGAAGQAQHSTHPFQEGRVVLTRAHATLTWHRQDTQGRIQDITLTPDPGGLA